MTKAEVMPDVDWEKMKCSTSLKLSMKDGSTKILKGYDYWWSNPDNADVIDGVIYDVVDGTEEYMGTGVTYLPNPDIESIEILTSQEEENHGSHPEVGYVFKTIKELYKA